MTFTAEQHSILVNRHGNRFVSENDFNIGERTQPRTSMRVPSGMRAVPSGALASACWMETAEAWTSAVMAAGHLGAASRRV